MAPTQTPTTTPKSLHSTTTPSRTPQSKHRLHFNSAKSTHPSPNPALKETALTEHPVEVVGRIRDYPDQKEKPISALNISSDRCSIRVRTEIGYRDFSLDGVSVSRDEDLDMFYEKFIKSRISGVKLGEKCTIMMYGPTGSGKSHTMFGCVKQPGIVYRALKDILGDENEMDGVHIGLGSFVQVSVLEIYNEEIYDLLSNNSGGGLGFGWPKGNASKVRLEVMGKKAKNATFISGNEAGKISREVAKVEKRRIVKSTLCNDRSSRSHCMIILDVPTVGGRLMLVDMAGSENIEQAGQVGFEAKMQTAKINQGNIALKRVVESIANGDSHVPFRDSKLTMLLQDSFEDDKSKILMILCASPDPKEMHKTISTLEYGAKAKCIVRGGHTPNKDKIGSEDGSSVILGSRIAAMDQFIIKLQMENRHREKERNEAHKELMKKEEEVAALRAKLELMERRKPVESEEEINLKVKEREKILKLELEKKLQECQKMADEFVEMGKRRMEEKILQQQKELELLRRRLEELETELQQSRDKTGHDKVREVEGSGFAKRLLELYADADQGMEKSMDLDMGDQQPLVVHEVKQVDKGVSQHKTYGSLDGLSHHLTDTEVEEDGDMIAPKFTEKVYLSTVFEEDEEGQDKDDAEDIEVKKEVVEESSVHFSRKIADAGAHLNINKDSVVSPQNIQIRKPYTGSIERPDYCSVGKLEQSGVGLGLMDNLESTKDPASVRKTRIQNIFQLCGGHRELAQHIRIPTPCKTKAEFTDVRSSPTTVPNEESVVKILSKENSPLQTAPVPEFGHNYRVLSDVTINNAGETPSSGMEPFAPLKFSNEQNLVESQLKKGRISFETVEDMKENSMPEEEMITASVQVFVKWEPSKECPGEFITKLKVVKDCTLADLRKLIEINLDEDTIKQGFSFLMLGDPPGAPVIKEKEATVQASKLPICNNQMNYHLACLRPLKIIQRPNNLPFSSLENKLQVSSKLPSAFKQHVDSFSPKLGQCLSPSRCISTVLR
ncbi:hypothetical protein IFM89_005361 [Coptis chinensis]|uniref:Kinesin-like protein KIN-10A n=1 Tax=Coptis chinensis TaxID=261450 RepID=A0A835HBB0_9MAGN|nr:hypothetical protein IFM89_005361 [Coptis chinensis]